jgi:ATP diphosphatase
MADLRDPDTGCPWDVEQDFASIAPYTIEEAYEVADAIARDDIEGLCDELGDLLLQVVFHARMAEEAGHFAFEDVAGRIADKMIRRHPHVFGSAEQRAEGMVDGRWEDIKAGERAGHPDTSALAGVARALPALKRAQKLGKRAAHTGFDWPDRQGVEAKIREEIEELEQAVVSADTVAVSEEFGDLLFAVVNLARHLDIDAEHALVTANDKFERRFRKMEQELTGSGRSLDGYTLEEMELAWQSAKVAGGS